MMMKMLMLESVSSPTKAVGLPSPWVALPDTQHIWVQNNSLPRVVLFPWSRPSPWVWVQVSVVSSCWNWEEEEPFHGIVSLWGPGSLCCRVSWVQQQEVKRVKMTCALAAILSLPAAFSHPRWLVFAQSVVVVTLPPSLAAPWWGLCFGFYRGSVFLQFVFVYWVCLQDKSRQIIEDSKTLARVCAWETEFLVSSYIHYSIVRLEQSHSLPCIENFLF